MPGRSTPAPPDSFKSARTLVLGWLAGRDLSAHEIRVRLHRRGCARDISDQAIDDLRRSGAIDDDRVARSRARVESSVRGRGRDRVLLRLRSIGIDDQTARRAVDAVFGEVDESALLDRALARRVKGQSLDDPAAYRRVFAALVRQGFSPAAVRKALGARRRTSDDSFGDAE